MRFTTLLTYLCYGLVMTACGGSGGSAGGSSGNSAAVCTPDSPGYTTASPTFMGRTKLLIGFSGDKDDQNRVVAEQAPFDMQYQYFNSGVWGASYSHASCLNGTTPFSYCKGWVTWQEDSTTRGLYAGRFVSTAKGRQWNGMTRPQIPFFTYYMVLPASGLAEGSSTTGETAALNDQHFLTNYFDDWRFLLQKIGNNQAILHIEPDFFGFLKARAGATAGPNQYKPSAIPAKVQASNPSDCSCYPDDAAGYTQCMIHMARKYAPNATVGVHVSPWVISDSEAIAWSDFLIALGARNGDFLVVDNSDRDADWYSLVQHQTGHDWDVAKMNTFLAWVKTVSETVGKPFFVWQLPMGNSNQNNTYQHYKDQRVELLFAHTSEVHNAHVLGLLFGPGEGAQTNFATDGGMVVDKTKQHYIARGGD